jgi:hypothetical protein
MTEVTREKALSIAIRYLGEQYLGKLQIDDKLPGYSVYNREAYENGWVVQVPEFPG